MKKVKRTSHHLRISFKEGVENVLDLTCTALRGVKQRRQRQRFTLIIIILLQITVHRSRSVTLHWSQSWQKASLISRSPLKTRSSVYESVSSVVRKIVIVILIVRKKTIVVGLGLLIAVHLLVVTTILEVHLLLLLFRLVTGEEDPLETIVVLHRLVLEDGSPSAIATDALARTLAAGVEVPTVEAGVAVAAAAVAPIRLTRVIHLTVALLRAPHPFLPRKVAITRKIPRRTL